jgi:5'-nucleotidase
MNSIRHHDLDITRAVFLQGGDPSPYIQPLSISLFLSANQEDVHRAVQQGYPAAKC